MSWEFPFVSSDLLLLLWVAKSAHLGYNPFLVTKQFHFEMLWLGKVRRISNNIHVCMMWITPPSGHFMCFVIIQDQAKFFFCRFSPLPMLHCHFLPSLSLSCLLHVLTLFTPKFCQKYMYRYICYVSTFDFQFEK